MCDNLGQVAGEIACALREADEGYEDIARWDAPSECRDPVADQLRRAIVKVLAEHDLTPGEFEEMVAARTSPRWLYWSGLMISDMFPELMTFEGVTSEDERGALASYIGAKLDYARQSLAWAEDELSYFGENARESVRHRVRLWVIRVRHWERELDKLGEVS